jgi:flagellar hook-associated protein 2
MATTSFGGIASGLDTQALIDATINASRQTRVKPNQDKVTELEGTNTALEELDKKLLALQDALKPFTTLEGGGISKTGTSSKESVVSASATAVATNGSYAVTVNALASNHTYSFNQTYSATSDAIQSSLTGAEAEADRTVTFTVGTGAEQETISVVITDGSYSIESYVNAFNSSSTKARAALVNVGTTASPAYKIVVSSLYEGTEKGTVARTVLGAALTNLSGYTESAAADASVSITGIGTITRATNSIGDVIPGVTLTLSSTGTSTVKISEDVPSTITKVQQFIDAYNEIVQFISENNKVTEEQKGREIVNVFAPLAMSRLDDNVLFSIRSELSETVASGGSAVRVFSDLGITTERDGTLKFDSAKLQQAVSTEVASVSTIFSTFADAVAATAGVINQYTRFNGLLDISIEANKTSIDNLNERIAYAEEQLERQAEQLRARFARLEATMGKLQSQQSSLTSALAGLK